jgi:hypothetical protein
MSNIIDLSEQTFGYVTQSYVKYDNRLNGESGYYGFDGKPISSFNRKEKIRFQIRIDRRLNGVFDISKACFKLVVLNNGKTVFIGCHNAIPESQIKSEIIFKVDSYSHRIYPSSFHIVKRFANGEEIYVSERRDYLYDYFCNGEILTSGIELENKYGINFDPIFYIASRIYDLQRTLENKVLEMNSISLEIAKQNKIKEIYPLVKSGQLKPERFDIDFRNSKVNVVFDGQKYSYKSYSVKVDTELHDCTIQETEYIGFLTGIKETIGIKEIKKPFTGWHKEERSYNPGDGESSRWDNVHFETRYWNEYIYGDHVEITYVPMSTNFDLSNVEPKKEILTLVKGFVITSKTDINPITLPEHEEALIKARNEKNVKDFENQKNIIYNNLLDEIAIREGFNSWSDLHYAFEDSEELFDKFIGFKNEAKKKLEIIVSNL